jgi:broad specificity phosphatase PhoE
MSLFRSLSRLAIAAALVFALAGWADLPRADAVATFYLVRHAEKTDDGSKDPALSEAGKTRAQALARQLRGAPLKAVYATDYRRTQATAQPTAQAHALKVTVYNPKLPAASAAMRLRQLHASGAALVVGHSNTVPELAAALCGCKVTPMAEDDYGRLLVVRIDRAGRAKLAEERF